MLAQFAGGPLDGITREVDIAFMVIEVFWAEGMNPETVPLFQVAVDTQEVWVYNLQDSDYDTFANYEASIVSGSNLVEVEPDVWTAAGRHFDVLNSSLENLGVEIGDDSIYFSEYDITVRLAQRQGE